VVAACGGGSGKNASTETPKPPQAPVETTVTNKLDSLAGSVVMVAPGTLNGSDFQPVASGSGTVVDSGGLILTNFHVVDPDEVGAYDDIAIYAVDNPKDTPRLAYFGGLAAWDKELDLAVVRITENHNGIQIDPSSIDLPVAQLGDSDKLEIGDSLTVLGYPAIGGGSLELTKGTVSGFLSNEGQKQEWIKTDARIAAGNSGGGAFDDKGELVGIPTAIYYVQQLGQEGSGRIRPVDLATDLLTEARATTASVIPQVQQLAGNVEGTNVSLISLSDLPRGFELTDESSLTNDDRAASYTNPQEALAFYQKYGRVGGVRRVFDDFNSADAAGTMPSVIVAQVDVYGTVAGAAGAATDCTEFMDTMWEFVTVTGLQFYTPDYVSDPGIGDQSCLYTAKEMVASPGEPPVLLNFVGFRQSNLLVVVGMMSLQSTLPYGEVISLAALQSNLLAQAGATSAPRQPSAPSRSLGYSTPEDAIAAYVAPYNVSYVGDCDLADPRADVGGYCSSLQEDRGGEQLYLGGVTFSEFDSWFLAERYSDGSWAVVDSTRAAHDSGGELQPAPW
jgi:S1-C subfamily serine protease